MLTVNKYKDVLLEEFYLDSDDITVRRNKDGWKGRFKKHDVVVGYKLCTYGYRGVHIPKTRTTVGLAQLITLLRGIDIPEGYVIDHIDGNDLNNSRSNIRIVSQHTNCKNQAKRVNNTTGYTGISWNASANSYTVRRTINGSRVYLGSTAKLDEAVELYDSYNAVALADGFTIRHGK